MVGMQGLGFWGGAQGLGFRFPVKISIKGYKQSSASQESIAPWFPKGSTAVTIRPYGFYRVLSVVEGWPWVEDSIQTLRV